MGSNNWMTTASAARKFFQLQPENCQIISIGSGLAILLDKNWMALYEIPSLPFSKPSSLPISPKNTRIIPFSLSNQHPNTRLKPWQNTCSQVGEYCNGVAKGIFGPPRGSLVLSTSRHQMLGYSDVWPGAAQLIFHAQYSVSQAGIQENGCQDIVSLEQVENSGRIQSVMVEPN